MVPRLCEGGVEVSRGYLGLGVAIRNPIACRISEGSVKLYARP